LKLRAGFALLAIGSVLLPVLSVSLFMALQRLSSSESEFVREFKANTQLWQGRAGDIILQGLGDESIDYVVIGAGGKVLDSDIEGIQRGQSVSIFEALNAVSTLSEPHTILTRPLRYDGQRAMAIVRILSRPPRVLEPRPEDAGYLALAFAVVPVIVLAVVMAFLFVRRLNGSIKSLARATERIAKGDLDTPVAIGGKDELSALATSFDGMRRSLKEEYARRARFVMGVSHDLRTPLAHIEGYAEALADGMAEDEASRERYVGIIREKARLLRSRIDDLIDYMRLDRGEWSLSHEAVAIKAFLDELCARWREDAALLGRRFSAEVRVPEACLVTMDRGLVERALENILSNAVRYSEDSGSIHLEASVIEDGSCVIKVSNSGSSIAPELKDRVFEPFFRASPSRSEGGLGLGLSVVKLVLDAHGWKVGVDSKDGETSFAITIPPTSVSFA
jgi:signal transduction histidine kinase